MPAPLSMDLRIRIVAHHEETGDGSILCSRIFRVGEATVRRLLASWRETGSVAPKEATGGADPKISDEDLRVIRIVVAKSNDLVRSELCDLWCDRTGTRVSKATMGRALKRADLTLKKRPRGRLSGSAPTSSNDGRSSARSSRRVSSKK